MMDKEFTRAGVLRPADIKGCGELAALKWFLEDVSPPYFFMSRWLRISGSTWNDMDFRVYQTDQG